MKYGILRPSECEHADIDAREDRFAAWVFNGGMWKYPGDEIVFTYTSAPNAYRLKSDVNHGNIPHERVWFMARSADGGGSWDFRPFTEKDELPDRSPPRNDYAPVESEAVDFTHPDLLLYHFHDHVMISTDRGKTFPHYNRIPTVRHRCARGRSDYVVRPDGACLLLSTLSTKASEYGRPVAYLSRNGGLEWGFLGYMTPEPENRWLCYPSCVRLPSGRVLAAVRSQMLGHGYSLWTEAYASGDGGRTWRFLNRVNDFGAPCDLTLLPDGRVVATYGYRFQPWGIRACISEDGGESWGAEIVLRDDGVSWDLGYPRSCALDSGEIFTAYYFNRACESVASPGGLRFIAGTRWNPDSLK
jgi:hypothetical protein